jgi:thiol-disulfide isomerase/thioredoxin
MNRRELIAGLGAFGTLAAMPAAWAADGFVDYKPGLIEKELAKGKTVFVDYSATWCGTCRRQERVISKLVGENPMYGQKMVFVRVDWDTYRSAPVTTDRNIPRRSTLIVLRGDRELGRIVAGTSEAQIKQLLDSGLA